MWVSTKAQYGMRALVEVALAGERPLSLKAVADRQGLPQQYLEQIFAVLRRGGFVESVRGAHGGYRVARPIDQVIVLEVVEALEGPIAPVVCLHDEGACDRVGHCTTEPLWREVDGAVRRVLASFTLADLVRGQHLLQLEVPPGAWS
jgi:Rrf2 family transcriptional regulator, cysteine metabolism repressor